MPAVATKIKIVLVDDHRMFREGLCSLLNRQENFSVIGEAGDGQNALATIEQTTPDVVVLDIHLPDMDGLQIATRLIASGLATKIIILSADTNDAVVGRALKIGVAGFLSKEEAMQELVQAIQAVVNGKVYLSPVAATLLVRHLQTQPAIASQPAVPSFSERELGVLKLVVAGFRNKEIADRLGIGVKSVESYRARVMAKARCSSPAELVRFALKEKLVEP